MEGYDEEIVKARDAEAKVRWILELEGGRMIKECMVILKDKAAEALKENGSSSKALLQFLTDLRGSKQISLRSSMKRIDPKKKASFILTDQIASHGKWELVIFIFVIYFICIPRLFIALIIILLPCSSLGSKHEPIFRMPVFKDKRFVLLTLNLQHT